MTAPGGSGAALIRHASPSLTGNTLVSRSETEDGCPVLGAFPSVAV